MVNCSYKDQKFKKKWGGADGQGERDSRARISNTVVNPYLPAFMADVFANISRVIQ